MREAKIPIHIQQFKPDKIYSSVWEATITSGLLPLRDRRLTKLIEASRTQPAEYFTQPDGQRMVEDVSQYAYQRLEDFFHLCSREDNRNETAYSSYRRYMGIANQAIHSLIEELAPDQKNLFTPKNAIDFIPEPGDLVKLLSMQDGEIHDKYRFEAARQVLLALTAAQLEIQTYDLSKRLNEVQLVVDTKLFNHGQSLGSDIDVQVGYLTDPNTNKVVSVSTAQNELVDIPEEYVHKSTPISMRSVPGEIGQVHIDPRFKPDGSALNKAIRDALHNHLAGKDGTVTAKTFSDAAGMRFIVANEFSTDGQNVTTLMNMFMGVLKDQYGADVVFHQQTNNKGKPNQSNQFKARKLYVSFSDGIKLEVMFLGIGDHLNNENHIGEYNQDSGTYNGTAHPLYSANRDVELMQLYFPRSLYGEYDEKDLLAQTHARITYELLRRDNIPAYPTRRRLSQLSV